MNHFSLTFLGISAHPAQQNQLDSSVQKPVTIAHSDQMMFYHAHLVSIRTKVRWNQLRNVLSASWDIIVNRETRQSLPVHAQKGVFVIKDHRMKNQSIRRLEISVRQVCSCIFFVFIVVEILQLEIKHSWVTKICNYLVLSGGSILVELNMNFLKPHYFHLA